MAKFLLIIAASLLLAYCSERRIMVFHRSNGKSIDLPLIAMVVMLSFFCGLRTSYNDTGAYISGFQNAPTLTQFWDSNPSIWGNPLFYWLQSFFRHHILNNYHAFFISIAFFSISCFVRFIRKYTENFTFSILLFFTLGLYVFNLAAMKQCVAMAVLTLSIPKLLKHRYISYYLLVFVAMLFHTYAIMFAILPLFTRKPWTAVTYIAILSIVVILFTFESTITNFLEYAEDLGKEISETEVFETQSINLFRLAVFAVPPMLSFVCRGMLWKQGNQTSNLMMNMSILSFLIMCLGLASAANLFGRCAIYFEIATIVVLPWIIQCIFTKKSAKTVTAIAAACYVGFFLYDNKSFGDLYRSVGIVEFFQSLF